MSGAFPVLGNGTGQCQGHPSCQLEPISQGIRDGFDHRVGGIFLQAKHLEGLATIGFGGMRLEGSADNNLKDYSDERRIRC
jgi:hypothetical protein